MFKMPVNLCGKNQTTALLATRFIIILTGFFGLGIMYFLNKFQLFPLTSISNPSIIFLSEPCNSKLY